MCCRPALWGAWTARPVACRPSCGTSAICTWAPSTGALALPAAGWRGWRVPGWGVLWQGRRCPVRGSLERGLPCRRALPIPSTKPIADRPLPCLPACPPARPCDAAARSAWRAAGAAARASSLTRPRSRSAACCRCVGGWVRGRECAGERTNSREWSRARRRRCGPAPTLKRRHHHACRSMRARATPPRWSEFCATWRCPSSITNWSSRWVGCSHSSAPFTCSPSWLLF